jgi:hypothetical protein
MTDNMKEIEERLASLRKKKLFLEHKDFFNKEDRLYRDSLHSAIIELSKQIQGVQK